jgi:hypothetical protein
VGTAGAGSGRIRQQKDNKKTTKRQQKDNKKTTKDNKKTNRGQPTSFCCPLQ